MPATLLSVAPTKPAYQSKGRTGREGQSTKNWGALVAVVAVAGLVAAYSMDASGKMLTLAACVAALGAASFGVGCGMARSARR